MKTTTVMFFLSFVLLSVVWMLWLWNLALIWNDFHWYWLGTLPIVSYALLVFFHMFKKSAQEVINDQETT